MSFLCSLLQCCANSANFFPARRALHFDNIVYFLEFGAESKNVFAKAILILSPGECVVLLDSIVRISDVNLVIFRINLRLYCW